MHISGKTKLLIIIAKFLRLKAIVGLDSIEASIIDEEIAMTKINFLLFKVYVFWYLIAFLAIILTSYLT